MPGGKKKQAGSRPSMFVDGEVAEGAPRGDGKEGRGGRRSGRRSKGGKGSRRRAELEEAALGAGPTAQSSEEGAGGVEDIPENTAVAAAAAEAPPAGPEEAKGAVAGGDAEDSGSASDEGDDVEEEEEEEGGEDAGVDAAGVDVDVDVDAGPLGAAAPVRQAGKLTPSMVEEQARARGEAPADAEEVSQAGAVINPSDISIPATRVVHNRDDGDFSQYLIAVRGPGPAVWRRYREFAVLHREAVAAGLKGAQLPGKNWLGTMNAEFVEKRRDGLEIMLQRLAADAAFVRNKLFRTFMTKASEVSGIPGPVVVAPAASDFLGTVEFTWSNMVRLANGQRVVETVKFVRSVEDSRKVAQAEAAERAAQEAKAAKAAQKKKKAEPKRLSAARGEESYPITDASHADVEHLRRAGGAAAYEAYANAEKLAEGRRRTARRRLKKLRAEEREAAAALRSGSARDPHAITERRRTLRAEIKALEQMLDAPTPEAVSQRILEIRHRLEPTALRALSDAWRGVREHINGDLPLRKWGEEYVPEATEAIYGGVPGGRPSSAAASSGSDSGSDDDRSDDEATGEGEEKQSEDVVGEMEDTARTRAIKACGTARTAVAALNKELTAYHNELLAGEWVEQASRVKSVFDPVRDVMAALKPIGGGSIGARASRREIKTISELLAPLLKVAAASTDPKVMWKALDDVQKKAGNRRKWDDCARAVIDQRRAVAKLVAETRRLVSIAVGPDSIIEAIDTAITEVEAEIAAVKSGAALPVQAPIAKKKRVESLDSDDEEEETFDAPPPVGLAKVSAAIVEAVASSLGTLRSACRLPAAMIIFDEACSLAKKVEPIPDSAPRSMDDMHVSDETALAAFAKKAGTESGALADLRAAAQAAREMLGSDDDSKIDEGEAKFREVNDIMQQHIASLRAYAKKLGSTWAVRDFAGAQACDQMADEAAATKL